MALITDDIRILIVADDSLTRAGLALLFSEQAGCEIVAQVPADDNLLDNMVVYQPDVLLWDLGWSPNQNQVTTKAPLDYLAELADFTLPQSGTLARTTPVPVVVLLFDETYASESWDAGAKGLLLRQAPPSQMLAALQAVVQGLVALDPTLNTALSRPPTLEPPSLLDPLTPRELEVLQHLAEGLSNKLIARQLSISQHTVKFHINAILSKLQAQSRTEAVVRATRLGLIFL